MEYGQVHMKAHTRVVLQTLSFTKMEELCEKHKILGDKFFAYQKKILIENKAYPLDFIMSLPKKKQNQKLTQE